MAGIWTHHSQVVVHGLKSAAQQLTALWVGHLSDAASILCVPDAQSAVFWCGHNDVIAERPGEVSHGTSMAL